MNILAVDIGSYSVKFLELWLERRSTKLISHQEVIIAEARESFEPEATLQQIQFEIIKAYFKTPFEGKVIFQYPENMTTTRYLDIPVVARKKVEMMIPFQLDEMLPFPATEAHYIKRLEKVAQSTHVTVAIAKQQEFFQFYNGLAEASILPNSLVSELLVVDSYFRGKPNAPEHPIMVLDIGHQTTKCYIIKNNQIVSNHISYVAGKVIDEMIAGTYKIDIKEAVTYKHQNCFFLTEGQYDQVSKEQQDFALMMKQAFWPLVMDIRRWDVGFRSKMGASIGNIYLTGGTSKINNVSNFLEQAVGIKVDFLDVQEEIIQAQDNLDGDESAFWLSSLMARIGLFKNSPGTFLFGPYSGKAGGGLSLLSTSFLFTRTLALVGILGFFLLTERYFYLKPRLKEISSKISKSLKSDSLALNSRIKRLYPKNPEAVIAELNKKDRSIEQSLKSIQSSAKVNAIDPLVSISRLLPKEQNYYMSQFSTDGALAKALFTCENSGTRDVLIERLNTLNLPGKSVEKKNEKDVVLTFEDIQ